MLLEQFTLVQQYKGWGIYRGVDPWVNGVFLVVLGPPLPVLTSRVSGYVATSIDEAKQLVDGAHDPNGKLAQWLECLRQRQVGRLGHEKRVVAGIRLFLRFLCEPGRPLSADGETTINCWIAAIDKELCALKYDVTDDLLQAVAEGNCNAIPARVQELVANREALMHVLMFMEGNDKLGQLLMAAIANRDVALALTKQLESDA
jgi:hypothetical protein